MTRNEMIGEIERILEMEKGTLPVAEKLADNPMWDSVAILSFIAAADKHCNVRLKAEQLMACKTVNDLLGLVRL